MNWLGYALISVVLYGIYYILLKKNLNRGHIWVYFAFFFTVFFVMLLPFFGLVHFPSSTLQWALIFFEVALLSLYFVFTSLAYKHLEESEVSPLGNLVLVFVVLIGMFVFHEPVSFIQMIGVFLMIVAVVILEAGLHLSRVWDVFVRAPKRRLWVYCIVLALVFSALTTVLEKIILDPGSLDLSLLPVDAFSFNFITRGLLMVFFLSYALLQKGVIVRVMRLAKVSGIMIIIAAVAYNLANIAYFNALSIGGNVSQVIPVTSLSTLFITLVGGSLFHEHHLGRKFFACVLMIVATVLIVG